MDKEFNSSTWRPENYCACWEESFHTVTEAFNRVSDAWKFEKTSNLGKLLASDI